MKHVVSVSIGSAQRDHYVELDLFGEKVIVERRGTDGDMKKAVELISLLDGKIDAFGMGGIDVYLSAGKKRYIIKDALPIHAAAKKTPIVDGTGLKISLEKEVPVFVDKHVEKLAGKKVFILPGIDRYGLAQGFEKLGCDLTFGDLMVALNINFPIRSLRALDRIGSIIAPIACRLPFEMLYPTGGEQNKGVSKSGKFDNYFYEADIIAGDYHYIRRYMPQDIGGKLVVTNTVTESDIEWMRQCGVKTLVTSTPDLNGRSFGTNVIEALLVALINKPLKEIQSEDYLQMLSMIHFEPRIVYLNTMTESRNEADRLREVGQNT